MTAQDIHLDESVLTTVPVGRRPVPRAADIALAGLLVALLLPVFVVVVVAIMAQRDGPVVFRQQRAGRDRRPFTIYKFRTMRVDNSDRSHREAVLGQLSGTAHVFGGGVAYKARTDPRVTSVGRVLRRLSLDELPQLFNVLKGDMSVVGPRPALVWEADAYPQWADPRFSVRPGLTGLWQVAGRNGLSVPQMLELDVRYACNRSLAKDVVILAKTVPTVLTGRGAA